MKLFQALSDIHKERAIHMAEHIVLDDLLKNGLDVEFSAENAEAQEHLTHLKEVIAEAQALENPEEKAEFLFENSATGEFIFERAYQLASTSLYIEEDEHAFHLDEIDSHFYDEDDEEGIAVEDEEPLTVTSAPKRDAKQLN